MKFEQNWLRGFRRKLFENVNGRTHGRSNISGLGATSC